MAATETKTKASTTAAAVSGMALWVLGKYVFRGDVPDVLASWIYVLVPSILAYAAGWLAPHTHRPDLEPPAVVSAGLPAIATTGQPAVRNPEVTPPVVPGEATGG